MGLKYNLMKKEYLTRNS